MKSKKKQAELAAYDIQREAELDAWEAYREHTHGIEQEAILRWFDALSGEGMVSLSDGSSLYCHFSAIEGIDKNNYTWPTDADRKKLEILGYNIPVTVIPYISYGGPNLCAKVKIKGLI
jgi:hypothetical protein